MMSKHKKISFPTCITLLRLVGAPILVPFFIVNYLPLGCWRIDFLIAFLFLLFGITDYLDGFFARKYGQETKIGAILDHLADKLLTFSALIGLLAIEKISYLVVLALVGRELCMMGLREIALEFGMSIRVSSLGKIKTSIQIITIFLLIACSSYEHLFVWLDSVIFFLVFFSIGVSWFSAFQYALIFFKSLCF